jgi:hypothetical protein
MQHRCRYALSLLTLLLFSSACTDSKLTVHTDYLSHENLASYYVGTPDPRLFNPTIGQRLIISWSLPNDYLNYTQVDLNIRIRFKNREEVSETRAICVKTGSYVYALVNDDYFDKGGILTYKVDMIADGTVIEEWRHQLWTELIRFDCDVNAKEEDDERIQNLESRIQNQSEEEGSDRIQNPESGIHNEPDEEGSDRIQNP